MTVEGGAPTEAARVYTPSPWLLAVAWLGVLLTIACGIGGIAWASYWPSPIWSPVVRGFIGAVSALLGVWGVLAAGETLRGATLLTDDAIGTRGLWGSRFLKRGEIEGFRVIPNQNWISSLDLIPRASGAKSLRVALYRPDAQMHRWLEGLTDLDEKDRQTAEQAMLADPALGPTPTARRKRIAAARAFLRWPNYAGWALCAWAWFNPHPYLPVMAACALLPLIGVAITALSRGAVTLSEGPRADASGLMMPGLVLMLRALLDTQMVDWAASLGAAAAIGVVAALAMRGVARDAKANTWALLAAYWVGGAAYGWGLTVQTDTLLDHHRPARFVVRVLAKDISRGRNQSYNLTLPPFGPVEAGDTSVASEFYETVKVGEAVCAYVYPGALGLRWYDVAHCETS